MDWQMEELNKNPISPAEEDPMIHRFLTSLQHHSPTPGFEDRVMARVFVPAPRWIRSVRLSCQSLVDSGRVWWLFGGITGVYAVALLLIVTLVARNGAFVTAVTSESLANVGLPVWRWVLGVAASVIGSTYSFLSTTTMSLQFVLAAAVSVTAVLGFNSWMLYRLMRPLRVVEIPQNVTH